MFITTRELMMSLCVIGAVAVGVPLSIDALMAVSCAKKADAMQLEHRYNYQIGCMVKVADRWMPINAVRVEIIQTK